MKHYMRYGTRLLMGRMNNQDLTTDWGKSVQIDDCVAFSLKNWEYLIAIKRERD